MFRDWRIKRLSIDIAYLDREQKKIQEILEKPDCDDILFRRGSERQDAEATLVYYSERKVVLNKKIAKLRVKRFQRNVNPNF